jgi:urea carboxylase
MKIPCRSIRLPLVLDHPDLQTSIQRYMDTTRPTAAYLPDNIEYLAKNNGYSSRREVFESALKSPFLIVAVGFLVGTPILFPLQPGSRIVGQKYNPTRVSTPGGTLGIAGSLFALYPVEAPGGYMLLARTIEAWDTFGTKPGYEPTRPWIYEPFDMVNWYEVSVEEYDALMRDYRAGKYQFDIQPAEFDVANAVRIFEASKSDNDVQAFKQRQKAGTQEMQDLEDKLYAEWMQEKEAEEQREKDRLKELRDEGPKITVDSPIDANVWKVLVQPGDVLKQGQIVAILEAMKMEINVIAEGEAVGAKVEAIASKPGSVVEPGTWIVVANKDGAGNS